MDRSDYRGIVVGAEGGESVHARAGVDGQKGVEGRISGREGQLSVCRGGEEIPDGLSALFVGMERLSRLESGAGTVGRDGAGHTG